MKGAWRLVLPISYWCDRRPRQAHGMIGERDEDQPDVLHCRICCAVVGSDIDDTEFEKLWSTSAT